MTFAEAAAEFNAAPECRCGHREPTHWHGPELIRRGPKPIYAVRTWCWVCGRDECAEFRPASPPAPATP